MQHGKKMHVAQMPPLTLVASGKCLVSAFDYRWSSSVAALCVCTQRLLQLLVKCSRGRGGGGKGGSGPPIFGTDKEQGSTVVFCGDDIQHNHTTNVTNLIYSLKGRHYASW